MCPQPPFLDDEKVTNINLWVSVNGSKSSTHYDPYQNVLCVVAGEKTGERTCFLSGVSETCGS